MLFSWKSETNVRFFNYWSFDLKTYLEYLFLILNFTRFYWVIILPQGIGLFISHRILVFGWLRNFFAVASIFSIFLISNLAFPSFFNSQIYFPFSSFNVFIYCGLLLRNLTHLNNQIFIYFCTVVFQLPLSAFILTFWTFYHFFQVWFSFCVWHINGLFVPFLFLIFFVLRL